VYKIAIIGAGNVAWHLAICLEKSGHHITDVYSRHIANAKLLSQQLYEAKATKSLNFSDSEADIVLIAISDDAISEVVANLKLPNDIIIAHTSGTQPINILKNNSENNSQNIGVFYPLQTFTKNKEVNFSKIPICIEANSGETLDILGDIATSLSKEVYVLDSQQRQALHVAAVMACNFTNHLFAIAKEILDDKEIDFEMLFPLINETINKAMTMNPKDAQTGPAKRNDTKIIDKHIKYLEKYPKYQNVYQVMTTSILESIDKR
jgi:predicted short-subunit dehydrogenase-like oxidoreductase (DUF2520 family)